MNNDGPRDGNLQPRLGARYLVDGSQVDFGDLLDRLYAGDADPADYEVIVEYLTTSAS